METAKSTDLPDLLEHLGYSIRRVGSRYHTTREMDSIRIKDRRTWKRYSNFFISLTALGQIGEIHHRQILKIRLVEFFPYLLDNLR